MCKIRALQDLTTVFSSFVSLTWLVAGCGNSAHGVWQVARTQWELFSNDAYDTCGFKWKLLTYFSFPFSHPSCSWPPHCFIFFLSFFSFRFSVQFILFSVSPLPLPFSTFYLLVTFFFLTGTGKDKGVWAAMASFQGKCEALGKIDLSFLPNIGLIWIVSRL